MVIVSAADTEFRRFSHVKSLLLLWKPY